MKNLIFILFLLFSKSILSTPPSNYVYIAGDDALEVYLNNKEKLTINNLPARWFLNNIIYDNEDASYNGTSYLSLNVADCERNYLGFVIITYYKYHNMKGGSIAHYDLKNNIKWDYVIPNSVGEAVFNSICSKNYH